MLMTKNTDWINKKNIRIDELTDNFSISKYNLLKISFLKRLIEESKIHSPSCEICKENMAVLEKMIEEIPHLDLINHRSPYEKKFNSIRTHFHKKHGFITPYQFSTIWTLSGIVAGIFLTISWLMFEKGKISLDPILAGAAFGLMIGYFWGSFKDAKYRKTKKMI